MKENKNNVEFLKKLQPRPHKGGETPIQSEDAGELKSGKLEKLTQIEKVSTIYDDIFMQPTVITIKKISVDIYCPISKSFNYKTSARKKMWERRKNLVFKTHTWPGGCVRENLKISVFTHHQM